MLKYIPYVLLFALVTIIVYAWGLWRSVRQNQDLSNMLAAKGVSKVKKALRKNKALTLKELEGGETEIMLKYIPYVLLFALVTIIVYAWGLWRSVRQNQDLSNMLAAKGVSKVKKALRKNKALTLKELEPFVKDLTAKQPFSRQQLAVTDPEEFLESILSYMIRQKMIIENKEENRTVYRLK